MKNKTKIQERLTNLNTLGLIPADEVQLNVDVLYESILDQICSVVQTESPRQVISCLRLVYDAQKKAMRLDEKDAYASNLMDGAGAMPLDDSGYPTDVVRFEATTKDFIGNFKPILPGTVKIGDAITDDGKGKLFSGKTAVGTVDYNSAIFNLTITAGKISVEYKYDIYNLITSRNFAKFVKDNIEVFAEMFQLDVDSALVLDSFKGVDLKKNIENILPQVLSQQIDHHVLSKYFELVDKDVAMSVTWDAKSIDWPYDKGYSVTDFYKDFGTLVSLQMMAFASRTGVVPNVILCDPVSYGVLSISSKFTPIIPEEDKTTGTPKLVGYYETAKVILLQNSKKSDDAAKEGRLVLTYKGTSDAQTAGTFASFIPVTLRTVQGGEAGGMIVSNTAYSIGGFVFNNPELVSGVKIKNLKVDPAATVAP